MKKKTRTLLYALLIFGTSCDAIQNWSAGYRQPKAERISDSEIAKWENDLRLSRERAKELHTQIHSLVTESNLQGALSWKIAKAYVNAGRYDLAGQHYTAALKGTGQDPDPEVKIHMIERTLPLIRDALNRNAPEPDLLFDAGICFANASRVMGWDEDRWRTAVLLFQRLRDMSPGDMRAPYQLALLYGKVGRDNLRDVDLAMKMFDIILKKEENNMPARFARAHIIAEQGDLDRAFQEYVNIKERLEALSKAGAIGGSLSNNPQYAHAVKNIDVLRGCVEKDGGRKCEILGYE